VKDGPAEASGVKSGDVILNFDGQDVAEMRDLPRIVADTAVEKEVDVVILRKGKKQTIQVVLGRLEDGEKKLASLSTGKDEEDEPAEIKSILGMKLSELTDKLREEGKLGDDVKGLVITEVEGGTPADDKGIKKGEIIVQIGQEPVESLADAQEQLEKLESDGRKNALLMVSTPTGDIRFVVVRVE